MIQKPKHLCYTLKVKEDVLLSVIKNIDRFYYESKSVKIKYGIPQLNKDGTEKTRTLHPSIGALKDIQKRIHQNLLSQIPIPSYAFGSVKGRNNIENAKQHLGNRFFLCVDLKSFFPSISNRMVFQTFLGNGFSPTVSRLLTQLTTYKGSLPQGAPTSPLLANLVFAKTGAKILDLIAGRSITFTSFLDDFSFSSKSNFKELAAPILEILKAEGYWLSHNKISYRTLNPEVTGIIVDNWKLIPHARVMERQQQISSKQLNRYVQQVMLS